jgi:hypothetical protein
MDLADPAEQLLLQQRFTCPHAAGLDESAVADTNAEEEAKPSDEARCLQQHHAVLETEDCAVPDDHECGAGQRPP